MDWMDSIVLAEEKSQELGILTTWLSQKVRNFRGLAEVRSGRRLPTVKRWRAPWGLITGGAQLLANRGEDNAPE